MRIDVVDHRAPVLKHRDDVEGRGFANVVDIALVGNSERINPT